MYNKLEIEENDYEYEKIVDHYFKNVVLFLKSRECWGYPWRIQYNRGTIQHIEEICTHRNGNICEELHC